MYRSVIGRPYLRVGAFVVLILTLELALITVGCSSEGNSSSSPPRASNLHGKIAFIREGGKYSNVTVFTAAGNGTHVRRLSDFGESPRFSPDGTKVAMAGLAPDGQRVTAGIVQSDDGSHLQRTPISDPTLNLGVGAWAPDGKQMALEGWDDSDPARNGVYIVGVPDGTNLVRLSKNPAHDIPMDFSPDGSQIVFLRAEAGSDPPSGSLYVMNVDGTGLHRITPPGVDVGTARWSPDGKWIVFAGLFDEPQGPVRVVRPDGTGLRKVFEDPDRGTAITPTWSPDGHMIMFVLDTAASIDKPGLQPNKLCVVNENGKGFAVVLDTRDFKSGPDWVAK